MSTILHAHGKINPTSGQASYFWKFASNAAAIAEQSALNTAYGFPMTVGGKTISNAVELRTAAGVYLYEPAEVARPVGASRVKVDAAGTEVAEGDRMIDIGGDPFDVFVNWGASNTSGTSGAGTLDTGIDTSGGAYQLDQDDAVIDGKEPMQYPAIIITDQIGPIAAFGRAWIAAGKVASGRRLMHSANAVGSTATAIDWAPDGLRYRRMCARASRSLEYTGNVIKGVLFGCGGLDAINGLTQTEYATALDLMINDFRSKFGATIPFVLWNDPDTWVTGTASQIKAATTDTPNRLPYVAVADVTGLASVDPGAHFSAASYRTLGATIATAMGTLIP